MSSYASIIRSTGLVGFVQVFKIFFGIAQSKILAIIVGPSGFGIWSLYHTFAMMVSSFSTLGIDQAGVRQIAKNIDNENDISKTLWVFRTLICFFSTLCLVLIILLRKYLSIFLFGNDEYAFGIIVVGVAIFFNTIQQSNISILNGYRHLRKLAYCQIIGAACGAFFSILFVSLFKEKGIALFILISSFIASIISSIYVKKLNFKINRPSLNDFKKESNVLLSIGLGIAYSAIIVAIFTSLTQVYIRERFGLSWVGMYNSSNTICGVYIGVVLSAMGVDLMPRLSKIAEDNEGVNKMVNEQMELGVLFSSIGVICVIFFAPIVLKILYSNDFLPATDIIRWHILSTSLRVLSFPLGYVLIVKKKIIKYIIVQTILWGGAYFMLILLTSFWGTKALGINYFITYIIYIYILYLFNNEIFKPSILLKRIILINSLFILVSWGINYFILNHTLKSAFGCIILLFDIYWVVIYLKKHMSIDILSKLIRK